MSDEKPDWEFWKNKNTVKLWEAAFLSCGIDPDSQSYRDILSFGLDNQKAEKCLRLLKDSLFLPQFFRLETLVLNISDSNLHSVPMAEFTAWCILGDLKIPPELAALAKASQQAALTVKVKPVPVAMPSGDGKPWLVANSTDPEPAYPWYTPARYFARQLVKEDSTLLVKKDTLSKKTAASLSAAGIFKRGKKKGPLSSGTVLKSFVNVTLS